eukprot:CAMPEP_0170183060 /NCGR_PEP_ID=MMETSP0040_2-20121228/29491_1 /TAXON_ID=641309 /ORGANISM="Lotharella oceanica, Strain CCMP622" /LENGTH=179 /DNA_ID=CAMNT_0010428671 /DNA_START=81 /DNA_END=621 /DNA_ORIENTATION=+
MGAFRDFHEPVKVDLFVVLGAAAPPFCAVMEHRAASVIRARRVGILCSDVHLPARGVDALAVSFWEVHGGRFELGQLGRRLGRRSTHDRLLSLRKQGGSPGHPIELFLVDLRHSLLVLSLLLCSFLLSFLCIYARLALGDIFHTSWGLAVEWRPLVHPFTRMNESKSWDFMSSQQPQYL